MFLTNVLHFGMAGWFSGMYFRYNMDKHFRFFTPLQHPLVGVMRVYN